MKAFIRDTLVLGLIIVLTYFGFINDIEGARSLIKFGVWFVLVPITLLMIMFIMLMTTPAFAAKIKTGKLVFGPKNQIKYVAYTSVYIALLVVLVWTGYTVTATAVGTFLVARYFFIDMTRTLAGVQGDQA